MFFNDSKRETSCKRLHFSPKHLKVTSNPKNNEENTRWAQISSLGANIEFGHNSHQIGTKIFSIFYKSAFIYLFFIKPSQCSLLYVGFL